MPNNKTDSPAAVNTGSGDMQADITGVSTRRRKLIKASAAAVPAIMTLRSGAAAAAASMNGCIVRDAARAELEIRDEDRVLGDDPGEPAHDEWARITGKAGRQVLSTLGASSNEVVFFSIRNENSLVEWDDIAGWDFYRTNGVPLNSANVNKISDAEWNAATNFYCVNKAGAWECVAESGRPVTPTVPHNIDFDAGKDVFLLVYVGTSMDGHIIGSTYYPKIALVQDRSASPITGSCLCSVDPDFNILG